METLNAKAALHLKEQELEALKEKSGLERESLQTEIRSSQHNAEISNLAWQTQFAKHVESLCAQCTGSIGALLDEKAHRLHGRVEDMQLQLTVMQPTKSTMTKRSPPKATNAMPKARAIGQYGMEHTDAAVPAPETF